MNQLLRRSWAAVFVAVIMFPLTAGASIDAVDIESVTVRYAASDLQTPEGQAALYDELKSAAHQVCGPTSLRLAGSVSAVMENRHCIAESLANAVAKVGLSNKGEDRVSKL